jgi:hypothetical protein
MACTPQQIKHTPQDWQAPNFTSMDSFYNKLLEQGFILCEIWSLPIWGRISQRAYKNFAHFGPQLAASAKTPYICGVLSIPYIYIFLANPKCMVCTLS